MDARHPNPRRGPRTGVARSILLALAVVAVGCAQQRFAALFDEAFARKALSCPVSYTHLTLPTILRV